MENDRGDHKTKKSKKRKSSKSSGMSNQAAMVPKDEEAFKKAPHSFIFHRGKVGRCVLRLVRDLRRLMEPYTAVRLKANKKNVLRDFVAVAGPLGVTHLLTFTRNEEHIHMRVIRVPHGPTLTFRVQGYVLAKDVISSLKKPSDNQALFRQHPLVVMNNFKSQKPADGEGVTGDGRHVSLMQTTLQNMFPSINVNTVQLKNIRRCVLFNYDQDADVVECRHYSIKVAPTGMSRSAKKLLPVRRKIPNLGRYKDISDYFLTPGQLSESEYEIDAQNEVELPQELPGRAGCERSSQAAVRLVELGPRLTLQLVKVETGISDGEVLYHKYIKKSAKQVAKQRKKIREKRKLKEIRKQEQEENIKRKRKFKNRDDGVEKRKRRSASNDVVENGHNDEAVGDNEKGSMKFHDNRKRKMKKVLVSKVKKAKV